MDLIQFKDTLDPLIQGFLDQKIKSISNMGNDETSEYLKFLKLFLSKGKRLRPYLAYLTYKAYGGKENEKILHTLISLELLHAFLLIHDDIMDKANYRHGIKTAHKYIYEIVKNTKGTDPKNFGVSIAILFGDYLFSWTHEILDESRIEKEILIKIKSLISKTMDEVVMGQMLDLNTTLKDDAKYEDILKKTLIKSAYYSFVRPMQFGALLTGGSIDTSYFEKLGKYIGIAFQTQDDLLNLLTDESKTLKSSFNDIEQRQQTFFTNFILNKATKNQKEVFLKYFGKKLTDNDKKTLSKLFKDCGAIEAGRKIIDDNLTAAKNIIDKSKLTKENKKKFLDLINLIESREN